MSDINTAVMPFSKGHVGLCSAPAIPELPELGQPGWRNSQGVKQVARPWQSWDRTCSTGSEPSLESEPRIGHSLLCALLPQLLPAWNKVSIQWCISWKGKCCAWTLSKLALVTLSCKGHFRKTSWNNLDICWGTKEKFIWMGLGFCYFCFNLH